MLVTNMKLPKISLHPKGKDRRHLVFFYTGSVFKWSVLVHGCSYNPDHSKTEPFQIRSFKCLIIKWVLNLNVRYLNPLWNVQNVYTVTIRMMQAIKNCPSDLGGVLKFKFPRKACRGIPWLLKILFCSKKICYTFLQYWK